MREWLFNKALRVMLLTNGLVLIAVAMLGPIYALFVEEIGGSLLDASLTGGVFALAAGITTLIAGRYADNLKRPELIIVGGYILLGIGFFLYNFVTNIWWLFAVQALIGFAEASYSPAFDAVFSRHLTKKKEGREWGAWESMHYFTAAGGAAIGGLIAYSFGFQAVFILMALLCFASASYIWTLPRKTL